MLKAGRLARSHRSYRTVNNRGDCVEAEHVALARRRAPVHRQQSHLRVRIALYITDGPKSRPRRWMNILRRLAAQRSKAHHDVLDRGQSNEYGHLIEPFHDGWVSRIFSHGESMPSSSTHTQGFQEISSVSGELNARSASSLSNSERFDAAIAGPPTLPEPPLQPALP